MNNIQPKIEELQKKYANDPQKLSEETMKIFKTE
jgi:YidC/Oxa1 family membrane protein insertase